MPTNRHRHGTRIHTAQSISSRTKEELLGLCRGITADNIVNQDEAIFLRDWIETNSTLKNEWPTNILFARVQEFLSDGILDSGERAELFELLQLTIHGIDAPKRPLSIPFDKPIPVVRFEERSFCLAGRFAYGPLRECTEEILNRGGWVHQGVKPVTDYLVVGSFGCRECTQAAFDRQLYDAVQNQKNESGISIISEDTWAEYLQL